MSLALMLLVTMVALTPALALVGIATARDIRVHGRPHHAYLYGGGFIALVMLARSTLNRTGAWYAVADALRTLVH
jgi:hypothetical protein